MKVKKDGVKKKSVSGSRYATGASLSGSPKNFAKKNMDFQPMLNELFQFQSDNKLVEVCDVDSTSLRTKNADLVCVFGLGGKQVLFRFGSLTPTYLGYLAVLYFKPEHEAAAYKRAPSISKPTKSLFAGVSSNCRPVDETDPIDYFMFACPTETVETIIAKKKKPSDSLAKSDSESGALTESVALSDLGKEVVVFPKEILRKNGVLSDTNKGKNRGKNAFRIWPPNIQPDQLKNNAARKTQLWQKDWFVSLVGKDGKSMRKVKDIASDILQLMKH